MTLRRKIILAVAGVVALFVIANHAIIAQLVFPTFVSLEQEQARRDMERVTAAIERENEHLGSFVFDWAAWDDTYAYIEDRNEDYADSNLGVWTFTDNSLNVIAYYDLNGSLVWGQAYDLESEEQVPVPELLAESFPKDYFLIAHDSPGSGQQGLMITALGPTLVASYPIITSDNEGPVRGSLLMARALTGEALANLAQQVRVEFSAWPLSEAPLPEDLDSTVDGMARNGEVVLKEVNGKTLRVSSAMLDIQGNPALYLEAQRPRDITAAGSEVIVYALVSLLAAGLACLAVMLFLLQSVVMGPLNRFKDLALEIASTGELSQRVAMDRQDEIGVLARQFDTMLQKLEESQQDLADRSYQSGMVAMATGALHNVRNAINPITLKTSRLLQRQSREGQLGLYQAIEELASPDLTEERRAKMADYLRMTLKQIDHEKSEDKKDLRELVDQVSYVDGILASYDDLRNSEAAFEPIPLGEVINDCLKRLPEQLGAITPTENIEKIKSLEPILASRIGLTQVLGNILINAYESVSTLRKGDAHIGIDADLDEIDGRRMIHIRISDNGEGIEPEKLDSIFQQGYTTRGPRGRGIGLHWSAHVVATMKGRLYAESEGKGKGAVFHIILPSAA